MKAALYLHIPYCLQKCRYCDFYSLADRDTAGAYVHALQKEIELSAAAFPIDRVSSVFFGGGTPTALSPEALCCLLEKLHSCFPIAQGSEISLECNPGTVNKQSLRQLKEGGFNRISFGLQSHSDRLLKSLGRIHSYRDFENSLKWAVEAGFDNINVDLMHGLPGQSMEDYLGSIEAVAALPVTHVSAYDLIIEEGTPLYRDVQVGTVTALDADLAADMEDRGIELLEERGFKRYEVSNFAKDGYQCRHNLTYWNNEPYLGLGTAAHSSLPIDGQWLRFSNAPQIHAYIRSLQENRLFYADRIAVDKREQMFESIMLGLRKVEGISVGSFEERFGLSIEQVFPEALKHIEQRGWRRQHPGYLALNRQGMDLLNEALLFFME